MIFSGMRTLEFYYCEYEKINGKLLRVSEYQSDKLENILKEGYDVVLNEKIREDIIKEFNITIPDLSEISNSHSHIELTLEAIKEGKFGNYNISEPFYMSEFIPKI